MDKQRTVIMMNLTKIKLIIFDFDGTLGKLNADWDLVRYKIKDILEKNNIKISDTGIHKMIELIEDETVKKEAIDVIGKYELEGVQNSVLFKNVNKTIKKLHASGYDLSIVTRNMKESVSLVLEKEGLKQYFKDIEGFDINKKIKPEPDQIIKIIGDKSKDSYIMVGDGTYDVIAAKKAGIKCICILGGVNSEKELRNAGANYIISNISELLYLEMK